MRVTSLYSLLFALSIIAINPFGAPRSGIWIEPKIYSVAVLTLLNMLLLTFSTKRQLNKRWVIGATLWVVLLVFGALATVASPFPSISLLGHEGLRDGLLYWALIACFALSNAIVLKAYPRLFKAQLNGLFWGAAITFICSVPQVFIWTLDYTRSTGIVRTDIHPEMLQSSLWKIQQPAGLFSHRAYNGFVLGFALILSVLALSNKWLKPKIAMSLAAAFFVGILLTQTRAVVLAVFVALVVVAFRASLKFRWVAAVAVGLAFVISAVAFPRGFLNGREDYWPAALTLIQKRPVLGYGFDGFGMGYAVAIRCSAESGKRLLRLNHYDFDCRHKGGSIQREGFPSHKAHNIILDALVSIGLFGALALLGLWTVPKWGTFTPVVAYCFVFGMLWYDAAQFGHWFWWCWSVALADRYRTI